LWELLSSVVQQWRDGVEWQVVLACVTERCKTYKRPHVLPNVARLVIGLLYGDLDVRKTLCTTVMCGSDPDCTAGAAGSIVGVHEGASGIPEDFREAVGDRLPTAVLGFTDTRISLVAEAAEQVLRGSPFRGEAQEAETAWEATRR